MPNKIAFARKHRGGFFTPQPVLEFMVREALAALRLDGSDRPPRILEPSCGDGRFLVEAFRRLCDADRWEPQDVLKNLFGLDLDSASVVAARAALAEAAAGGDLAEQRRLETLLSDNLRCGNALVGGDFSSDREAVDEIRPFDWLRELPQIFSGDRPGFDAVVGNPPYLNIRLLTRVCGAAVKRYLIERYETARGNFDLYPLFLEKALELLRPGGVCGLIVPNKIAAMDYARPCRRMLIEQTTLISISDLSHLPVFPDAGVYPYVVLFRKQPPPTEHRIFTLRPESIGELAHRSPIAEVLQSDLSADGGLLLDDSIAVETRVPTKPLGEIATLHSGTMGYVAGQLAACLREAGTLNGAGGQDAWEFIVSGNVDRYSIRLGGVRFMGRRFERPLLPRAGLQLSPRKLALYTNPKIVIAGMTRRLEAALDDRGLALGVQIFAATDPAVDFRYLLGILNSKLLSHLFAQRFPAKRLAGGYLAINKSQLARLPIRIVAADSPVEDLQDQSRLMRLVGVMHRLQQRPDALKRFTHRIMAIDEAIDGCVRRLYRTDERDV